MARHLWGAIKLVESDRCFAHCRYRMWAITLVDQTSKTIVGRCIFIQFFDALSSHSSMAYVFFRLLCGNNSRNNMLDKQTIILNWRFLLSSDCRRSHTLHFNLMLKVLGTDTHKLTAALMHTKSVSLSLFFPHFKWLPIYTTIPGGCTVVHHLFFHSTEFNSRLVATTRHIHHVTAFRAPDSIWMRIRVILAFIYFY